MYRRAFPFDTADLDLQVTRFPLKLNLLPRVGEGFVLRRPGEGFFGERELAARPEDDEPVAVFWPVGAKTDTGP